ncbi:hypothetical protein BJY16_003106 [Actinoplanes octamycinicus]|uniref:Uncharacterized protein n=1 Tax=Actinoplanes octamycinicus TaxID=135948 RepID=A0A7W7GWR1_9ACTN|nr:hypothetical protein [Actinoplanes octamycinicus]MBB4739647.1 hypothetical protein [Actinoplanes octamycinicus]GIE54830.1 hypothetical protein Aoc01nite_02320 [Actinoplanes octamycinicus]
MGGETNPYPKETYENTHAPWLSETTPVDVDLDGLREYADLMGKQQTELNHETSHIAHLHDTPSKAWTNQVLGEAAAIRQQLQNNASELSAYLSQLGQSFFNIGSAAQTIADIYADGDATSAASMNDVLFAFGDKSVPRPDGLPKEIGQTYIEAMVEQSAKNPAGTPGATSPEWTNPTVTTMSPYQQLTTSKGPNGQRMEKVVTSVPGSGVTIETTTIYNAKNEVLSTQSVRTVTSYNDKTHTLDKQVESSTNGTVTGHSKTSTTYDNTGKVTAETTVNSDANNKETSTKEFTTAADGSTTEKVTRPAKDEDGNVIKDKRDTTDMVKTGASTTSASATPPTRTYAADADPIERPGGE